MFFDGERCRLKFVYSSGFVGKEKAVLNQGFELRHLGNSCGGAAKAVRYRYSVSAAPYMPSCRPTSFKLPLNPKKCCEPINPNKGRRQLS